PPQKLEAALGEVADQVPGLVQPPPRGLTEGMREELLRRQVRTVKIIPRQPIATDIKLPRHPYGHRLQVPVQDIHLGVGNGAPNGDGSPDLTYLRHWVTASKGRVLRETIPIDKLATLQRCQA